MTDDEARQEARYRWGAPGKAERWQQKIGPISKLFVVGRHAHFVFEVFGEGDTWEEAFENANYHIAARESFFMTDAEALDEARRRWGEDGYVRHQKGDVERFTVGITEGVLFWAKGEGQSWEEAFRSADTPTKKRA